MISNEPYWTLAEAVVWICTRDFTRVSSIGDIRSDAALAEETYKLLSEITRTVVDLPDLNEIRDGAPKASWNVSGSADDQIIERARDGSVGAIGRRTWDGPLERIPPAEFTGLRIYTIPDRLQRGQSIDWLDVQFARADVLRQWPEELLAIWPSDLATTPAPEGQEDAPAQTPQSPDNETPSTTTAGAQTRCQSWLFKLMKEGNPTQNKAGYRKKAKIKYNVGTKAFDRAWGNATAEANNAAWSKSGPKKKASEGQSP